MAHATRADLPRIAELLITTGQRLAQTGDQAWLASLDFAPGPKATVTNPDGGGNRWETDTDGTVWPVPAARTGDTAVRHDPTSLLHVRLRQTIELAEEYAVDLRDLLIQVVPGQPNTLTEPCGSCGAPKVVAVKSPTTVVDDIVAAGWCASCYRLGQRLEPIAVDSRGVRRSKRYCRWCAQFKADWTIEPPVALLEIHHTRGRVAISDIERHVPKHVMAKARKKRAS